MILNFKLKPYKCNFYDGLKINRKVCFVPGVQGYNDRKKHVTFIIYKRQQQLSYTFFNRKDLLNYFYELSNLLGFTLLSFVNKKNHYRLQIECADGDRYFLYIATLCRYTWEYPYSLFTYAAYKNKSHFPELSIIQIVQFYISSFINYWPIHQLGKSLYAFRNINDKCTFNILKGNFNHNVNFFVETSSNYLNLYDKFYTINTKQLDIIINYINSLAEKLYAKSKKDICSWTRK